MAITSPETRINQQDSKNINYIEEFNIGEDKIKLVNGINAIIRENGSEKSILLRLLNNKVNTPKYVKNLIEINQLYCENKYSEKDYLLDREKLFKNSIIVHYFQRITLNRFHIMHLRKFIRIMPKIYFHISKKI